MTLTFILNNTFRENFAFISGAGLYVSNSKCLGEIVLRNNIFYSNWIHADKAASIGSIIHLSNPGMISIQDSFFRNNSGILGTCIYYSEATSSMIQILGNVFKNNNATLGGSAIYLMNHYDRINIVQFNSFIDNKAYYANDFTTPPIRLQLNSKNKDNTLLKKNGKLQRFLNVIPGISILSLKFEAIDFFGEKIRDLPGASLSSNLFSYNKKINSIDSNDGKDSISMIDGYLLLIYHLLLLIIL